MRKTCRKDSGSLLIVALLLMLGLTALGAGLMGYINLANNSFTEDFDNQKAYYAARAGVDYGMYLSLRNDSCPASSSLSLPKYTDITIKLSCTRQTSPDGATKSDSWTVYACSTATCPGTVADGYNEKKLIATVTY